MGHFAPHDGFDSGACLGPLFLAGRGHIATGRRWFTLNPPKDHPSGIGLQNAGDRDAHFLTNRGAALLHYDHRAIIEVANSLAHLVSRLDQANRQDLTRQRNRFKRVGHFVQVDHFHPLQLRDLVEVKVIGNNAGSQSLGKHDQAFVHFLHIA